MGTEVLQKHIWGRAEFNNNHKSTLLELTHFIKITDFNILE